MEKQNNTTVLTIGTFDLPHKGHFNLLRRAKQLGEKLIVGINTDEFVKKYKGKKPVMNLDERASIIEQCKYVDIVVVNEDNGLSLIKKIKPSWIVIGSDWLKKDYINQIGLEKGSHYYNLYIDKIIYVPYTESISSSELKKRINK